MIRGHRKAQDSPPEQPDSYLTLADSAQAEIKVQRSRFLATAVPAESLVAAKSHVAEMAALHHDCRHVCFAWRGGVGRSLQEIRNDGGEPTGTAGEPILVALRQIDVTDCVVVVVRYFGGVKLGTGGLARAYGEAAQAALANATLKTVVRGREFMLCFPYSQQKTVSTLLKRYQGKSVSEGYADQVTWRIWLPEAYCSEFAEAVQEASAGIVSVVPR